MFEDLFIDRGAIARYRAAPLLRERLSYPAASCAGGGTAAHTAQDRGDSAHPDSFSGSA